MPIVDKRGNLWTDEEHLRFIEAVRTHGKDWTKIAEHVGSRTNQSLRDHAKVFVKRAQKDPELEGSDIVPILTFKRKS